MEITINTRGAYLHVKDNMFEVSVRNLETKEVKRHTPIAAHKVKSIMLNNSVSLSAEAVRLAMENNVDIVFLKSDGFPVARVWHSKLGSTTKIRKKQLETSLNTEGVRWIKKWIVEKVENQRDFIKDLKKHRAQHADFLSDKIQRLDALLISIQTLEGKSVSDIDDVLRGLEGTAGRLFFETISYVFPKDFQFEGRSFRPAKDLFNAFLNYAYGFLYRRVEKSLIMAGIDPYLGFLHRDDYNQKSMVFDFIEPYRIWADEAIFRLFTSKKVNQSHGEKLANGVTLSKEGKELVSLHFAEFLDSTGVRHKNRNVMRGNIIQLEAHAFAMSLLGKEAPPLIEQIEF